MHVNDAFGSDYITDRRHNSWLRREERRLPHGLHRTKHSTYDRREVDRSKDNDDSKK